MEINLDEVLENIRCVAFEDSLTALSPILSANYFLAFHAPIHVDIHSDVKKGYLCISTGLKYNREEEEQIVSLINTHANSFFYKLKLILEEKFYKSQLGLFEHWRRIFDPSNEKFLDEYYDAEQRILVWQLEGSLNKEYIEKLYIDISTLAKMQYAGYYILDLYQHVKIDEYDMERYVKEATCWNGTETYLPQIAEEILSMKAKEFEKGAHLAWWLIHFMMDMHIINIGLYNVINPILE